MVGPRIEYVGPAPLPPEDVKALEAVTRDQAFQAGIRGAAKGCRHYAGMAHSPALSVRVKRHLNEMADFLDRQAAEAKLTLDDLS